jgi:Asp-tRNA(Asn)/Glu-tRNA(Gln) amidotransferase B subunit
MTIEQVTISAEYDGETSRATIHFPDHADTEEMQDAVAYEEARQRVYLKRGRATHSTERRVWDSAKGVTLALSTEAEAPQEPIEQTLSTEQMKLSRRKWWMPLSTE